MNRRPDDVPFTVDSDTPLGRAVTWAHAAAASTSVSEVDNAYVVASRLATGDPALWRALAVEHVSRLLERHAYTQALQRCTEYLTMPGGDEFPLRLPRAEIHSTLGQHDEATRDTRWIRSKLSDRLDSLTEDDRARLLRVEGWAATENGDLRVAKFLLEEARDGFRSAGNDAGVAQIATDLQAVALRQGDPVAAREILAAPHRTPIDQLLLAMAHKSELRYEHALEVLDGLLARPDLDPSLRKQVKYEKLLLLLHTQQVTAADALLGELQAEVTTEHDPLLADAVLRLSKADVPAVPVSDRFDPGVQHARRLIADKRIDDAEKLLTKLHPRATSARDIATWNLVSGELELARRPAATAHLWKAAGHFEAAAAHAEPMELAEVRVLARFRLGTVRFELGEQDQAMDLWHEAGVLANEIARRQLTDEVRVGMLAAVLTNHDMLIDAVAARHDPTRPDTTAAVVVAMETARKATLVDRLVADSQRKTFASDLPSPTDLTSARRWVAEVAWSLPRSQVIWMIHPGAGRVHHTLVGRGGFLRHLSFPVAHRVLAHAIEDHVSRCSEPELLVPTIMSGAFDRTIERIATLIGIDEVLAELPPRVSRIALAPARELAEVAFAAMPVGGTTARLGNRFALSYLLCLSARQPLHHRSRGQRGNRTLLVRPPARDLQWAVNSPRVPDLAGHEATEAKLRAKLESRAHQVVRIDSHGKFGDNGYRSAWLRLASHGADDGLLDPESLQTMNMRGCGTVILGVCDSGMAERRGQEERFGFVRAALVAGGASVIAAEWGAHHRVAAALLDRFEHYLRFLPRDVALHRAQQDLCDGRPGMPTDVLFYGHPAYWACWGLYGDTGIQTQAGPVHRLARKTVDAWRNHVKLR